MRTEGLRLSDGHVGQRRRGAFGLMANMCVMDVS